jgi:hypothetical protein
MTRTCLLQHDLYPVEALDLCEREFSHLCVVVRRPRARDIEITIEPGADAPPETTDEFLNFLLSAALERHLGV